MVPPLGSHIDVSKVQLIGSHASVPPPAPRLVQSKPLRFAPSHCSFGLIIPSPHAPGIPVVLVVVVVVVVVASVLVPGSVEVPGVEFVVPSLALSLPPSVGWTLVDPPLEPEPPDSEPEEDPLLDAADNPVEGSSLSPQAPRRMARAAAG